MFYPRVHLRSRNNNLISLVALNRSNWYYSIQPISRIIWEDQENNLVHAVDYNDGPFIQVEQFIVDAIQSYAIQATVKKIVILEDTQNDVVLFKLKFVTNDEVQYSTDSAEQEDTTTEDTVSVGIDADNSTGE